MNFHVITIFPEIFRSFLTQSMMKRAVSRRLIKIETVNPRDFVRDKNKKVDDRPYGGGPGMILKAEPILKAISKIKTAKQSKKKIVILSPRGKTFNGAMASLWAKKYEDIVFVAGRYEGIDGRVKKILKVCLPASKAEEISIGPYVLAGGELPAMIVMEAVSRHIPGVLGKAESLEEKRLAAAEVYTRPEVIEYNKKKFRAPKVLLSGHHGRIELFKKKKNARRA